MAIDADIPPTLSEQLSDKNRVMTLTGTILLVASILLSNIPITVPAIVLAIVGAVLFYSGISGKRHDELLAEIRNQGLNSAEYSK